MIFFSRLQWKCAHSWCPFSPSFPDDLRYPSPPPSGQGEDPRSLAQRNTALQRTVEELQGRLRAMEAVCVEADQKLNEVTERLEADSESHREGVWFVPPSSLALTMQCLVLPRRDPEAPPWEILPEPIPLLVGGCRPRHCLVRADPTPGKARSD